MNMNTITKPIHTASQTTHVTNAPSASVSGGKNEVITGGLNISGDEFEVSKRPSADVNIGSPLKTVTPETVTEIKTNKAEEPVEKSLTIANGVGALLGTGAGVYVIGVFAAVFGILGGIWALPFALAAGVAVGLVATFLTEQVQSRLK